MWTRNTARQLLPLLVSAVAGVICTIVIAIIVAVYSPQPTRWTHVNEHTPSVVNIYRSLASERLLAFEASDSERVVGNLASGFGYKSLDIQHYDTSRIAELGPREPLPVNRRSFLTELGWPNVAFATNARSIGLRFGSKLGPNSPSDDAALHDGRQTTARVLWAGLCLNSLLLATLFLMPWVLFRRGATCCYRSRAIVATVCIGLWFALLTAWGGDLVHHVVPFLPQDYDVYDDPIAFDSAVRSIDIPPSTEWDQFFCVVSTSIGYHNSRVIFSKAVPNRAASVAADESLLLLGWPVSCLKGPTIGAWQSTGDPWPEETRLRHVIALMAMPVWWPGMLVNWMFYALAIVVVVRGPVALRRFYRRRRHRCPMCGYPVGEGSRCSECGQLHRGRVDNNRRPHAVGNETHDAAATTSPRRHASGMFSIRTARGSARKTTVPAGTSAQFMRRSQPERIKSRSKAWR